MCTSGTLMTLMIRFRLLKRDKLALNLLKKGLLVRGEAMEASKRRRSMLDYIIQQLSKGSSEGSVQDVSSDEENKADVEVAEKQARNEQLRKIRKWTGEMVQMIDNLLLKRRLKRSLECFVGGRKIETDNDYCQGRQNRRDIPKDIPIVRLEVLSYDIKRSKVRMGIMPTKTELVLEQTQQGVSDKVLVSIEGVEE
ncbi:hypothetical protein Tco_1123713 [Tanacetum coccineum]|uniref:Uncharacterized protein n=1 Tax=Tanacetum coccineum TaxID=301880 RepID=A0ABQ5J450_9ASTR